MKVLVVGAAGYLGRNVWKELERRGHEVVPVDGLFWNQPPPPGLIWANVDATGMSFLMEEHTPDSVIWLGAIAHDPEGKIPAAVQKEYTYARPVTSLETDRARSVFVSSLSVFNPPGLGVKTYPDCKREAERELFMSASTRCSVLRFGTLFGPGVDTESYREHLLLNRMVYTALKHGWVEAKNPAARRPVFGMDAAASIVVDAAVEDAPPEVSNHYDYCRTILDYGKVVADALKVPLVIGEGKDTRDYGWADGYDAETFARFLPLDLRPLVEWTRENLENIKPRRQIFEVEK